jgi:O-antigen/teichoic acid export membrane protein
MLGTNLLVAEGRISQYNGFEIANRYLALGAVLFSVWYWRTPQALLLVIGLLAALMCLPLYAYLQKLDQGGGASLRLLRSGLGYAMRAYMVATLAFFVLRMNALLLEKYTNPTALGLWSIAAQIIDVIIVIPNTAALVLLPRIIRSDQPYQLMQSQLRMVAACLALVCVAAVWFGRDAILLVYGARFEPAYAMLLWGLPGAFALGLTSILSQYLASVGMPFAVVWIWFIGLVVEFVCALWWIPKYGGEGAMASLSVAYSVVLGLAWRLAACKR